jgi:hypothetical protein
MGNKRKNVRAGAAVEPLETRQLMSVLYVSNSGNDGNSGSQASPLATLQAALNDAQSGDTIMLRGGTYTGGVRIDTSNLTIDSAPGEMAKIVAPTNDAGVEVNIRIGEHANNVALRHLDLSGGYYYTVKTESTWDTGDSNPTGPQNLIIADSKIHDSGRDVIKLTPKTDYARIVRNEIYNSGRRDPSNAEGVDAVQANYAQFLKNYVHDTTTNGVYFKGGSVHTVIARNRVERTGHSGILVGQSSDENWFDTSTNPNYYESIDAVVRNNVVRDTQGAGIGAWAAKSPRIFNNTLINVAQSMFGGLLVQGQEHWTPNDTIVPSTDVTMFNNIVQVGGSRPAVDVRSSGLTGTLTMEHNLYSTTSGAAPVFQYDDKNFSGSLSDWQALGYDQNSKVGDPKFSSTGSNGELAAGSAAINAGRVSSAARDYDGNPRVIGGVQDIGAQEFQG